MNQYTFSYRQNRTWSDVARNYKANATRREKNFYYLKPKDLKLELTGRLLKSAIQERQNDKSITR